MAALALIGLHLTPPVRGLTRDAVAVEARTLARASRLVLKPLPRMAAGGPIGRAALGFAAMPDGDAPGEALPRLRRLVVGLARLRAVESVSILVRPGAGGTGGDPAPAAGLPSVEVPAGAFESAGEQGLLPDRVYVVSVEDDEEERPAPRRASRALTAGDPE
ncbi:MAG TPA: hypothetical protein VF406_01470 [Thermodesulfobacteriota bacterium]